MKKVSFITGIALSIVLLGLSSCTKEDVIDTPPELTKGTVMDIDSNVYETVKIGNKMWMTSNLKTLRFQNGDSIPTTIDKNADVSSETNPVYQWAFNADTNLLTPHGRLYTIGAVIDARGICPEGWRIPSYNEITELFDLVDGDGGKLKSISGWEASIQEVIKSDNSTGFTALASGERYEDGSFVSFELNGKWWTQTYSSSSMKYWTIFLNANYNNVAYSSGSTSVAHSCRCLKDS